MTQPITYNSIAKRSEVLHKDRNSKFYGYAIPVQNTDDIKSALDDLKLQYPDASHICYAYILGIDQSDYRANDDGEPNNSAGQPILRQIKALDITNVLVAVVRYFGGKKLGVPGLIDAYGQAAQQCLEATKVITKTVVNRALMRHVLGKSYQVYSYADRLGYEIIEAPVDPMGYFVVEYPQHTEQNLLEALKTLPNFELKPPQSV